MRNMVANSRCTQFAMYATIIVPRMSRVSMSKTAHQTIIPLAKITNRPSTCEATFQRAPVDLANVSTDRLAFGIVILLAVLLCDHTEVVTVLLSQVMYPFLHLLAQTCMTKTLKNPENARKWLQSAIVLLVQRLGRAQSPDVGYPLPLLIFFGRATKGPAVQQ